MSTGSINPREIKEKILTLGIGPSDLAGCNNVHDEFSVIMRKSADLKNFCDPSEYGYASRIREINRSQRIIQEKMKDGEISSFSDILTRGA